MTDCWDVLVQTASFSMSFLSHSDQQSSFCQWSIALSNDRCMHCFRVFTLSESDCCVTHTLLSHFCQVFRYHLTMSCFLSYSTMSCFLPFPLWKFRHHLPFLASDFIKHLSSAAKDAMHVCKRQFVGDTDNVGKNAQHTAEVENGRKKNVAENIMGEKCGKRKCERKTSAEIKNLCLSQICRQCDTIQATVTPRIH